MAGSPLSGRRVLVTGASGFLGAHVARALAGAGASVRAAVRKESDAGDLAGAGVSLAPFDLSNEASVSELIRSQTPDIVIHAAAYGVNPAQKDPDAAYAVNVGGTWSLLKACASARVERFIHLGSCFEYAPKDGPLSEDDPLGPSTAYAASKAASSLLVGGMSRAMGMRSVVLRVFGTWGPGESADRLAPQIVRSCREGTRLALTKGDQVRDFTYVKDMAERIVRLAEHPDFDRHPVVNVGGGEGRSVRDFAGELADALGGRRLLDFGALPHRPAEFPSLVADVARLKALIGPLRRTDVAAGARDMAGE